MILKNDFALKKMLSAKKYTSAEALLGKTIYYS